jgi:uncharacterized protein (DUF1684 family)
MTIRLRIPEKCSLTFILIFLCFWHTSAQTYTDSLISFQQNYINNHEVVGKNDKKFIHFYPVDKNYCVMASFKKIIDTKGFDMSTASGAKQHYFRYGFLTFSLQNSLVHLYIYQSASLMKQEKYKDYLFVPFGDATSGFETYGGGRYLDFTISDIKNNHLVIDFNKAYNPYCAYTTGYNCPIPPKENLLTVSIPAGEKNYGKPVH